MQELGFKHPMQINLTAVIALTRGFLMLFQSFLEEEKYAEWVLTTEPTEELLRAEKSVINRKKPIARKV